MQTVNNKEGEKMKFARIVALMLLSAMLIIPDSTVNAQQLSLSRINILVTEFEVKTVNIKDPVVGNVKFSTENNQVTFGNLYGEKTKPTFSMPLKNKSIRFGVIEVDYVPDDLYNPATNTYRPQPRTHIANIYALVTRDKITKIETVYLMCNNSKVFDTYYTNTDFGFSQNSTAMSLCVDANSDGGILYIYGGDNGNSDNPMITYIAVRGMNLVLGKKIPLNSSENRYFLEAVLPYKPAL